MRWTVIRAFALCRSSPERRDDPMRRQRSTTVLTPVVQAQPDGVHIDVEANASANLAFVFPGNGRNAEDGPFISTHPPGEMLVACLAPDDDPGDDSLYEVITVVDQHGYYLEQSMTCAGAEGVWAEHPVGLEGNDPIAAVGGWLKGIVPTDVLERVGYVARERDATVAVRRDGELVAAADLKAIRDGWGWVSFSACPDSNIRY
jgi:hypothetical protein